MSNIYIQEPPSTGKVLLETTVGDIDIELWSREAPKACRNFCQLCLEGYYDNTVFHRLVKGFIVQGGDPTGTGTGGSSIYGKSFKDEFHQRLRFVRRGLVAMANAGKDDNGSQFFFTFAPTPELQNKHTIFGKVTGDTIYNMLKLEDGIVDDEDRPKYPHKILRTKVLSNPFDDIVPRVTIRMQQDDEKDVSKSTASATKNYNLLSFGDEAEEEEQEIEAVNKKYTGKSKSSHDLIDDRRLSSKPAYEIHPTESDSDDSDSGDEPKTKKSKKRKQNDSADEDDEELKFMSRCVRKQDDVNRVRDLLKSKKPSAQGPSKSSEVTSSSNLDTVPYQLGQDEERENKKRLEAIKEEVRAIKKSMREDDRQRENLIKKSEVKNETEEERLKKLTNENSVIKDFVEEQRKYTERKTADKATDREAQTLALLSRFKSKLETAKETHGAVDSVAVTDSRKDVDDEDDEEDGDDVWMARSLHDTVENPVLAKDANKKSDDWFEIYDPRNPMNRRRREADKKDSFSGKWTKSKLPNI